MKKGFSLIELMVVVVIIGILAAIAIPNFIRLKDRAKESEVKANAHTIQLAAEEYSTSSDGLYCPDAGDIHGNLNLPGNMKNPFTAGGAHVVADVPGNEGEVGYDHDNLDADPYTIIGAGKGGTLILTLTPGM